MSKKLWIFKCSFYIIFAAGCRIKRIMRTGTGEGILATTACVSHYYCFPPPLDTYNTLAREHGSLSLIGNRCDGALLPQIYKKKVFLYNICDYCIVHSVYVLSSRVLRTSLLSVSLVVTDCLLSIIIVSLDYY